MQAALSAGSSNFRRVHIVWTRLLYCQYWHHEYKVNVAEFLFLPDFISSQHIEPESAAAYAKHHKKLMLLLGFCQQVQAED